MIGVCRESRVLGRVFNWRVYRVEQIKKLEEVKTKTVWSGKRRERGVGGE